jgi:DNA ligase D-like protein (predicted 3'-phosphoesterase)
MINEIRRLRTGEPACQNRSDSGHLKFIIHTKDHEQLKFDFTIELNGVKSWAVPDVPSMNPLEQRPAEEDQSVFDKILQEGMEELDEPTVRTWDKGSYIPIDEQGRKMSEREALACLQAGVLAFVLQGKKLVGEFVLMRKEQNNWLLMKRHDEFALYNYYSLEEAAV